MFVIFTDKIYSTIFMMIILRKVEDYACLIHKTGKEKYSDSFSSYLLVQMYREYNKNKLLMNQLRIVYISGHIGQDENT